MEEQLSDYLTIEPLIRKDRFQDNFQLCNYAIRQVQNIVKTGNDNLGEGRVQNKAYNILEKIMHDEDMKILEALQQQQLEESAAESGQETVAESSTSN